MKTKLIILLFFFLCTNSLSYGQAAWIYSDIISVQGAKVRGIKFLNLNTGFALVYDPSNSNQYGKIFKTTNKGVNWSLLYTTAITNNTTSFAFDVIDDKIFITHDAVIKKVTGGSSSVTVGGTPGGFYSRFYKIKFVNSSTGYVLFSGTDQNQNNGVYVMKTTNQGENWNMTSINNIWNGTGREGTLYDLDYSPQNPDHIYVVGSSREVQNGRLLSYWFHTTDGFNTVTPGNITPITSTESERVTQINYLGNGTAIIGGTHGVWSVGQGTTLLYTYSNPSLVLPWGMEFKDNNTGYIGILNGKLHRTTNGGGNWIEELTINSTAQYGVYDVSGIYCYNDIIYVGTPRDKNFYVKRLNTNINTYKDNVSFNGNLTIDNVNYNTPSSQYLYGGTIMLNSDMYLNNESILFYKWPDNNMNFYNHSLYFDTDNYDVAAYYKSKNISINSNAISTATLTKSIRDTAGVIHQIHNSMGSIFYSKSANNGQSFGREEIVNQNFDNTADGNVNPMISEIKTALAAGVPAEKNIIGIWQRREGNNEVLKSSVRNTIDGVNYYWQTNHSENISFSAPQGFNAFPHIFSNLQLDDYTFPSWWPSFIIRVYLKWDNNTTKLILKKNNGSEQVIDQGNITELAVARNALTYNTVIDLHISYLKDGKVYYTNRAHTIGTVYNETSNTDISAGDGNLYSRNSIDISVRNTKPVITYAARNDVYRIINWDNQEGGGQENPDGMNLNFYPIIVRYKEANGNWSIFYKYNSNGSSTQQNPDVEGSKDNAAHLVNFSVNNSQFKQFVKIDNQTGYYCSPAVFNGTDAKLVKGSYIGQTGANSYPMLLTLSPQSNLYTVGKQSFSITNDQTPISDMDAFSNLFGTMDMNEATYCYNIGPIFVRNQLLEQEDPKGPLVIENVSEFNENMVSDVFQLSNGDTLILGAYGLYRPHDDFNEYSPVRYRLNLINNSTQSLDRVLFEDTITVEDSVEIQFLRGYVINELPYTDSFYVQIEVNPDDGGDGDGFGMGGGYDPPSEGEGDNSSPIPGMKVFFENDFTPIKNTVIPDKFALNQNYPNPFNPVTTISFDLPKDSKTNLIVYDITGREITRLVNNKLKQAGRYNVTFNAINLASGIYFYRIQAGDFVETKRMVLLK